jgi:Glycosyltransferase family 87
MAAVISERSSNTSTRETMADVATDQFDEAQAQKDSMTDKHDPSGASAPPGRLGPRRQLQWDDQMLRSLRGLVGALAAGFGIALILFAIEGAIALSRQGGAGFDWYWYQDGLQRLADDRPLYDPILLSGPYDPYDQAHLFVFTLIPPSALPLLAPMQLVPEPFRLSAWLLVMAGVLAAALALVWPTRLALTWQIALLGFVLLAGSGILAQLYWANLNAVVALGVALVWRGIRDRHDWFVTIGLVLIAVKVTPAICIGLWVLGSRGPRPILVAVGIVGVLALPAVLAEGPHVLGDFVRSGLNLGQSTEAVNIAPSLALRPILGERGAIVVTAVAGILAAIYAAVRAPARPAGLFVATLAGGFLIPGLWVHWLTGPIVAALAWIDAIAPRGASLGTMPSTD